MKRSLCSHHIHDQQHARPGRLHHGFAIHGLCEGDSMSESTAEARAMHRLACADTIESEGHPVC